MKIIEHIVGTRKPLRLRLKDNAGGFLDLSNCVITFRGASDTSQIEKSFAALPAAPTVVKLLTTDIVDESKDKFAQGRFHLEFATGEDYASQQLYIQVKR